MKGSIYAIIYILLFSMIGCQWIDNSSSTDELSRADTTLVGPTWHLIAFEEKNTPSIEIDRPPADTLHYSVIFTTKPSNECLAGAKPKGTWCLNVIGYPNTSPSSTYDFDSEEQSLSIYFKGSTLIGLPQDSREPEFFEALDNATSYQIKGKQLRIFHHDNKSLLFEPVEKK